MKIVIGLFTLALSVGPRAFANDNPPDHPKVLEHEQAKQKAKAPPEERMPNPDTMTVAEMHKHCKEMMAEPKTISNQELLIKYSKLAQQIQAREKSMNDSATQSEAIRKMPNPDTLSAEALRQHCKDMMKEPTPPKPQGPHSQKGHKGVD